MLKLHFVSLIVGRKLNVQSQNRHKKYISSSPLRLQCRGNGWPLWCGGGRVVAGVGDFVEIKTSSEATTLSKQNLQIWQAVKLVKAGSGRNCWAFAFRPSPSVLFFLQKMPPDCSKVRGNNVQMCHRLFLLHWFHWGISTRSRQLFKGLFKVQQFVVVLAPH